MTPKKDEYMRGYGDGFKDGSAEMLATLKLATAALEVINHATGSRAIDAAIRAGKAAIAKAVQS